MGLINDGDFLDALEFGDIEGVKNFSNNGKMLDVNLPDAKGRTPIYIVAYYGFEEILDWLLNFNPDLNIKDNNGKTALDVAVENGNNLWVELLNKLT